MTILTLDFETTKVPRHRPWTPGAFPVSLHMLYHNGAQGEWVLNHSEREEQLTLSQQISEVQTFIDRADILVGQNLKFDLQWLWKLGINTEGKKLFCTMVADFLINGQRQFKYDLNSIADRYNIGSKEDAVKKFWDAGYETDEIPLNILMSYGMQDTKLTYGIYCQQVAKIKQLGLERVALVQMELMEVLAEMEYVGFLFDTERAEEVYNDFIGKVSCYEEELRVQFGVPDLNLSSNQDLSTVLYGGELKRVEEVQVEVEKLVDERESFLFHYKDPKKEPVVKWRKVKKPVTVLVTKKVQKNIPITGMFNIDNPDDKEYLSVSKNQLACLRPRTKQQELVLNLLKELSVTTKAAETLRGKSKDSGLICKAGVDRIIHPSFNQTVARTGRLSSSSPNSQNTPRSGTNPIKTLIIPRGGLIGNGDLSQLEWRAAIWQSQDPIGIHEIMTGVDQHRENAILFFGADPDLPSDHPDFKPIRTTAKVFTFRLLYGGSAYGMYMDNTMPRFSKKRWQEIVGDFCDKYSVLTQWQLDNIAQVHKSGGWLQIPTGRWFYFPRNPQPDWNGYFYQPAAIKNYPTQGFATADVGPLATVIIRKKMKQAQVRSKMILTVHDSVVFDLYPEEQNIIADIYVESCKKLPEYISTFFKIKFDLPLSGTFEVGPNYGDMKRIK